MNRDTGYPSYTQEGFAFRRNRDLRGLWMYGTQVIHPVAPAVPTAFAGTQAGLGAASGGGNFEQGWPLGFDEDGNLEFQEGMPLDDTDLADGDPPVPPDPDVGCVPVTNGNLETDGSTYLANLNADGRTNAVTWSQNLAAAAQWHASDMVDRLYVAEQALDPDPHGKTPTDRVVNAGFDLTLNPTQLIDSTGLNASVEAAYASLAQTPPDVPNLYTGAAVKNSVYVFLWATAPASPSHGTVPEITDPDLLCDVVLPPEEPCPPYTYSPWPIECPTPRTYANMQAATAEVLVEGNRYRASRGYTPLAWNDNLAAAAQWHATYLYDNWNAVELTASSDPQGEVTGGPHGDDVTERANNAGFTGTVAQEIRVSDSLDFDVDPMESFCAMKNTWNSETETGDFYMFTADFEFNTPQGDGYIGIGWKKGVYVYVIGKCSQNEQDHQYLDMPEVGDVKSSIVAADHLGWYVLDGRAVSSLPQIAQDNATALGFGANLPDATDAVLGRQSGQSPGAVTGTNDFTLARNNLPEESITSDSWSTGRPPNEGFVVSTANQTAPAGATYLLTGAMDGVTTYGFAVAGHINLNAYSAVSPLNDTGSQLPLDLRQKTFNVNSFVYLNQ